MRVLKEDWAGFKNWLPENKEINELQTSLFFTIKEQESGQFLISITSEVTSGAYSEIVNSYSEMYDFIGRVFTEEDGILDNMLNK